MRYATSISPTDFRDYAKERGWTPVAEAIHDRLFVLNHPGRKYRQIIVPMDTARPDYDDAVRVAIETLAEAEEKPFQFVEASLVDAGADTLRFGVSAMRHMEDGLPLSYAVRAVKGVENALRAAACSEVHRQPFHPKMKRSEAQKLVETAQMRHTESGSFVLKVACPLDAIPSDDGPLFPRPPFVRRAVLGMSEAIRDLVGAIEADTLETFVERARTDGVSPLSSNLCESLLAFQDEDFRANLDFSVAWSARLRAPDGGNGARVRVQWDYFPRIAQVGAALRPAQSPRHQAFYGIVDELKGDLDPNEKREGEVILDLLVDGESIKAKANLNVDHHRLAHQAYGEGKSYIRVVGLLHPGNQPRRLTDIQEFSFAER
jgi:hypothetical protein